MSSFEIIVGVALLDPQSEVTYVLTLGSREDVNHDHGALILKLQAQGILTLPLRQGFITSSGKFLSRFEAVKVAKETGQIPPDYDGIELTSICLRRYMKRPRSEKQSR